MYYCLDCEEKFERPYRKAAKGKPTDKTDYCPYCDSKNIEELVVEYCRCCGRKLKNGNRRYCSSVCISRGPKMYERQEKRLIKLRSSPIYQIARKIAEYNKKNNTDLSYGQYVALVCGG